MKFLGIVISSNSILRTTVNSHFVTHSSARIIYLPHIFSKEGTRGCVPPKQWTETGHRRQDSMKAQEQQWEYLREASRIMGLMGYLSPLPKWSHCFLKESERTQRLFLLYNLCCNHSMLLLCAKAASDNTQMNMATYSGIRQI